MGRFLHCTRGSATIKGDGGRVHGGDSNGGERHWVELFDAERHEEAGKVCISCWEANAAVYPSAALRDAAQVHTLDRIFYP